MVRGDDKSSHEVEDAITNDYVRCPGCGAGKMKKDSSYNFYCPSCGTTNREFVINKYKMEDFHRIIDKLNEFNSFLRNEENYKRIVELYQIGVISSFPWLDVNPITKLHTEDKDKVSETGSNVVSEDASDETFRRSHKEMFDAIIELFDAIIELPEGFCIKDVQQKLPDYTERSLRERLEYLIETGVLQTIQSRGGVTTIYRKSDDLLFSKEDTHGKRIRHIDEDTYQLAKKVMAKYTNYNHIDEFITECCEYCLKHKYGITKESDIHDRIAQSNVVEDLLIQFTRVYPEWEGAPSDLFIELTDIALKNGIDIKSKDFPKSANRFTRKLNTIEPNLRKLGIIVERKKCREKGRILRITSSTEDNSEGQLSSVDSSVDVDTIEDFAEKSTPTSRLAKNYEKKTNQRNDFLHKDAKYAPNLPSPEETLGYGFNLFEQTNTVEQKPLDIESIYRESPKYLQAFLKGVAEWYLNKFNRGLNYPWISFDAIKSTTCMAPDVTQDQSRPDKILERVIKQSDFINIKFDQIIRIVEKDGDYYVIINQRRFKDLADMLADEVRRARQRIAENSDIEPKISDALAQKLYDKYQFSDWHLNKLLSDTDNILDGFYHWMKKSSLKERTINNYIKNIRFAFWWRRLIPAPQGFYYLKQYLEGYDKPIRASYNPKSKRGGHISDDGQGSSKDDDQPYMLEPAIGSDEYLTSSIKVYPNNREVKLIWPIDGGESVDVEISDVYSWFEEISTWAERKDGLKYLSFHRFKSKLYTYFQQMNTKEDYSDEIYYLVFNFYGLDERFNTKIERRKIGIVTDWVIIFEHSYDSDLLKPEIDTDWFKKDRRANIEVMNDR